MRKNKSQYLLSNWWGQFFLLILLLGFLGIFTIQRIFAESEGSYEKGSNSQSQNQKIQNAESGIRMFTVKYYQVQNVSNLINQLFRPSNMIQDEVRHLLIIEDNNENLDKIEKFLKNYDIPPKVILVEGTILKINMVKALNLGSKLEKLFDRSSIQSPKGTEKNEYKSDLMTGSPANLPSVIFKIFTESGKTYNVELNTLIKEGAAEVVLKPHITFISGTRGNFEKTTSVPQVSSGQYGTNVNTVPVGLTLEVEGYHIPSEDAGKKPQIYLSKLKITDGSVGSQVTGASAFFTDNVVLETTQLVEDGQLIILGGSISKDKSKEVSKIPILGDIPIIKTLFRNSARTEHEVETLALLRISIIEENSYAFKAAQYPLSKHLQPIEFGGEINDSIKEHPLRTAKWSSKIIYNEGLYFDRIHNKVLEDKQLEIESLFKNKIRNRILLTQEWDNTPLVGKLIFTDDKLADVFKEFANEVGVAPLDILLIARHIGAINDVVYEIYYNFLKENKLLDYEPK